MMISQVPLAKKYSTAYLNVYGDSLTSADIEAIQKTLRYFKKNHNFMHLICVISIEKGNVLEVFDKLCGYFHLPQSLCRLMALLAKRKLICYLKDILQDICVLYKMRNNILSLEIKTAAALDDKTIKIFEDFFAKESHFKIESHVVLDTSLIAGVRLQSDFFIWEHSVVSRLKSLKHKYGLMNVRNGF